jgi:hypothetical protein
VCKAARCLGAFEGMIVFRCCCCCSCVGCHGRISTSRRGVPHIMYPYPYSTSAAVNALRKSSILFSYLEFLWSREA